MPYIRLSSDTDSLDLGDYDNPTGVQALAGLTGLGLPPVAVQFNQGAGNGARYRGRRYLERDISVPLRVAGGDRAGLKDYTRRLSLILESEPCRFTFVDDRDEQWYADTIRVGGGDFSYGDDTTGEDDLLTVVTMRAGEPFFIGATPQAHEVRIEAMSGLLKGGSLVKLRLSPSQAFGTLDLDNPGDAPAPAVWTAYGPGSNLVIASASGETLNWQGSLTAGQWVRIDTGNGTVVDQTGANRYNLLATAPKFWKVPPNKSTAIASLDGGQAGSTRITCEYNPRRKLVV